MLYKLWRTFLEGRKKRTLPPPKENHLKTFSGLKEKLSSPMVDTKPCQNQESRIYHRNLSFVAPIFLGKEKFFTGAGRCMLSFSQSWRDFCWRIFWALLPINMRRKMPLRPKLLHNYFEVRNEFRNAKMYYITGQLIPKQIM